MTAALGQALWTLLLASVAMVPSNTEAAARPPSSDRACEAAIGTNLTTNGVGVLRLGSSASAIRQVCPAARTVTDFDSEGGLRKILRIDHEHFKITADINHGKIVHISIYDPHIKDPFNRRVGDNIVGHEYRSGLRGFEADGRLIVEDSRACGLSYITDYEPSEREHKAEWTELDLKSIESAHISSIEIFDCEKG